MNKEKELPKRKSIRLSGWDYASPWWYYVTICTQENKPILGEIRDGEMHLNDAGKVVEDVLRQLPKRYENIELDATQIMPNHLHTIIIITHCIVEAQILHRIVRAHHDAPVRVLHEGPVRNGGPVRNEEPMRPRTNRGDKRETLPVCVGFLKMNSAKQINQLRRTPGERLWKRNYYEHIIRNEKDLERIRHYIGTNVAKWDEDEYNPENFDKTGPSRYNH